MPIRGDRVLVEIPEITVNRGTTVTPVLEPIIVKMKRGIAEFFELEQLGVDDARLYGTFGAGGNNEGATFVRNIGGFKEESYTCHADGFFSITEYYYDANDNWAETPANFKSFSFGLPKGHTVNEVLVFLLALPDTKKSQIKRVQFPSGRSLPFNYTTASSVL